MSAEVPPRNVSELIGDLVGALTAVSDPAKAGPMKAYMKEIAPFLGVPSPARRSATKTIRSEALKYDEPTFVQFCIACFAQPEREFHYVALDALDRRAKKLSESTLPVLRSLAETKSWWDSIDSLSTVIGAGVVRFVSWQTEIEKWATDSNFWIRRIAILHQLGQGVDTDTDRLFRIVLANASDREFFIRKAIGWALRDLAWKRPDVVLAFVDAHRADLSPLSVREATKNLRGARTK